MASFTNQAHLSYNGRSVASNVVTGQMLSPLTLTKTAVVDTYAPTDTVTYVITIVNSGATAYTDLTLTDDLGAYAAGGQTVYPLSYTPIPPSGSSTGPGRPTRPRRARRWSSPV